MSDLLVAREGGVLTLTMNRPERRNALSVEMLGELADALAAAEADPAVAVVVLTGAGGAFCAGGDVKGFAERTAGGIGEDQAQRQRVSQRATVGRLFRMPKPTVAVLPGPAAGAGLSLALACDLRVAADTAVLVTAFAGVALSGDYGSAWLLEHLVGPSRAKELLFLSPRLSAVDAAALGLVNRVVPAADLPAASSALVSALAAGPALAYAGMKANVALSSSLALEDYMDVEVTHHLRCFATEDHVEAAKAFVEKRAPVFQGR